MSSDLETHGSMPAGARNRRILLVDDQEQLHEDYRKILALAPVATPAFDAMEAEFFGDSVERIDTPSYELTSTFQGEEAIAEVERSLAVETPFALAFVDVRMPPGIDGIATTERLFELDPELQVVISTAYADYAWEEIYRRFGPNDRLLFLRKPFDSTEVHQIASTLTMKWALAREARLRMEELEDRVRARTAELEESLRALQSTQGRLVRSEKLASLGRLVAGLAHEINTPVGAIVSSCDAANRAVTHLRPLLPPEPGGGQSARALDTLVRAQRTIDQASRRMADLVESLRRFAHLDRAENQWLDLRDSVRTVLTVLSHQLGSRITVETSFEEVPAISCHPGAIHQLVLGLLENAIEAIEGKGRIEIRTRAEGETVHLEIRDDGKGMEPERIESLFDVGWETRADRVQVDWGLTAIHQIVEDHRGTIHVESEPARGTRVLVTLPVLPRDPLAPPRPVN
ncbi:MAG: ATP-binding protein [Candidatus Eisenbacteria bacterium]